MTQTLVSFALISLYLYPSILIVKKYFTHKNQWERAMVVALLSSIVLPLYIYYTNHFLHIPLNQKNIFLSILILNIFTLFALRILPTNKHESTPLSKEEKYVYLFSSAVAVLYFGFAYIFNNQPIVGGDTPHYLYNTSLLIYNQFPKLVFDRSIVYYFPAIISIIANISVEVIMKMYIALYELIFILTSITLAKKYISPRLLIFFSIALIFSPATLILSKFTIAFFISMTVVYYIISSLVSGTRNIPKNLLLPILWGSLFNLHGVVAFASLIIIPPILLCESFKNKISPKKYFIWVILFLATSQPLISTQWDRIDAGIVQPIITSLGTSNHDAGLVEKSDQLVGAKVWVDEFVTNKSKSLSEFPLNKDSFTSSFFILTLILAILGVILAISNKDQKNKMAPILITALIFFTLTQQEYMGMEWFPRRFVFSMGPLIYLFSFMFIDYFFGGSKKSFLAPLLCFFAITLPTIFVGAKDIPSLSSNISPIEHVFISGLNIHTRPGDSIFVGAPNSLWVRTLIADSVMYKSDHQAICNDQSVKSRISTEKWEVGKAFSSSVTLEESIEIFKRYSQDKPYYVYLDTTNYHCINGDLFPASQYELIDQKDGYMFLKHQ